MAKHAVILYSGGLDSYALSKLYPLAERVYVDTHSRYSRVEISKLPVTVRVVDFDLSSLDTREDHIVPGRNSLLIHRVVADIISRYDDIDELSVLIGATAGDRVLDKSSKFLRAVQRELNIQYAPQHWRPKGVKIRIEAPLHKLTKREILEGLQSFGIDLELAFTSSFSCYEPIAGKPCWICKPCVRKLAAFYPFIGSAAFSTISYERRPDVIQAAEVEARRRSRDESRELVRLMEALCE